MRPTPTFFLLLCCLAWLTPACSEAEPKSKPSGSRPSQPASTSSAHEPESAGEDAAPAVISEGRLARMIAEAAEAGIEIPGEPGRIAGVVLFEGEKVPRRREIVGPANTVGCKEHAETPLTETTIVNEGRLQNVCVYVKKGLKKDEIPAPSAAPVLLDQEGCLYVPHVLGMQLGQTLKVHNADELQHNVNCRANRNQRFNQMQPNGSKDLEWTPTKREVFADFGCDIHPWMSAKVAVLDSPFFAISGPDGSFAIEGLPPGDYQLEARHEKGGSKRLSVLVPEQGGAVAVFHYEEGDFGR